MRRSLARDTDEIKDVTTQTDPGATDRAATYGGAHRLLVVANRLPVTARLHGDDVRVSRASGGLATGLRSWQERSAAVWIGWPGDTSRFSPAQVAALDGRLRESHLVPVPLTVDEVERYYEGFANQILWPLCHYLVDRVPVDAAGWAAYVAANEKFTRAVLEVYQPGDLIWVHDYQLMLVPGLLRAHLPKARIGYFHHIPFPSSEVFRVLPWRSALLRGLLGADVVGFHTHAYQRHFLMSLLHLEGIEADVDSIAIDDRRVHTGVFPMGIDAAEFDRLARDPEVQALTRTLRADADTRQIVLGVDRLDYTKGIPRRLMAFQKLFARRPDLRDRVRYIQVAVPSRERMESYRTFRRQLDELVGRLNGSYATLRSTPVHYLHRSVSRRELVALYGAADVMLVTPLRDGMNLVAKEFVASRPDGDGVLVLSEFAGAASELADAVVVNPYDVDALSVAIESALEIDETSRRSRMAPMRARVLAHDVHAWAEECLAAIASGTASAGPVVSALESTLLAMLRHPADQRWTLLLDYDGTLVPIVSSPELAAPDPPLLALLARLAQQETLDVHIVSGRPRETLEQWLGAVPVTLWAEHGYWHRSRVTGNWRPTAALPPDLWSRVLPLLRDFEARTPGSRVEVKTAAVAWHHRLADPAFGDRQAHELRMVLGDALSNQPLEVVEGKKVIEVRLRGVSKMAAANHAMATLPALGRILAVGDDRTDEDMFAALPEPFVTVKVGGGPTAARYRIADPSAVRRVLASLVVSAPEAETRPS